MKSPDPVLRRFGFRLKQEREARGMTQEQLAEKATLDRTYLSDVERGFRNIGIKNVVKLATALDVAAGVFFGKAVR